MSQPQGTASKRLTQIKDFLTMNKTAMEIPWDPNSTIFPMRKNLPAIPDAPSGAAWVWGQDDYIGRLNLLTPTRVAAAGREIRTGEIVPVNLPLDVPSQPAFGRQKFQHEIKTLAPNLAYDDTYSLNTQSGTQWDGFRHYAHAGSNSFYNNTKGADIVGPKANDKAGIHHWAEHGIAGRGLLLDFRGYAAAKGIVYDPCDYYPISYEALRECGRWQGVDIRPAALGGDVRIGDMLFVRSGWTETYWRMTEDERVALGNRKHLRGPDNPTRFAGVAQEENILDWIHDSYFAAVAGDAPAFEAWPVRGPWSLHEHCLALWGMPFGEMLDLEKLARTCAEKKRYFFFFTSAPANCRGGVGSHVNGTAVF